MHSPKTWHDLIPASTMEKDKENLLLRHIMDFHIHPVDSLLDEPEERSPTLTDSSSQEDLLKLEQLPRSKSWRRLSEGSLFLANQGSPNQQPFRDTPQPLPHNRLWLKGPKMEPDPALVHYPVRNPAWRVLNMDKSFTRGRPRVPDHKAMQRLNISPVRNEPNRRHISKIFIPPKTQCVRVAGQGSRRLSDEMKKLELTPTSSLSSDYCDLSEITTQRSDNSRNRDPRPARDALVDKPHDVSCSQTSSEQSSRPMKKMSIVTIAADAELRKVICSPEAISEPKKIATKHLKNCLVTYIPENGSRFVTYVPDNASQADSINKELNKKIVSGEYNKSDIDSSSAVDIQSINHNKMPGERKSEGSEVNSIYSNNIRHTPKFISKRGTRGPIRSLTSRAIPIDSPDLNPVCAPAAPQLPTTQTKGKYIRRREPVSRQMSRDYSTCSSYAPSFPDSTIMAHIQRAGVARNNLKFNRNWTHHQKSYVTDPVKDFRKEVKKIMKTPQGMHLKPRMVQAPSGHPKIIACHIPNAPSTSHAAVRYIQDRNRMRQIESAPMRLSRRKNYAVVLPNAHHRYSGMDSPPIYVMSSPSSMHVRSFHNEMDV